MQIIDLNNPPKEILEELSLLISVLDEQIPPKKLDRNVLICTWNIRAFGNLTMGWEAADHESPKRDGLSLLSIVEIIRRFDIIAVQEVKGEFKALRETMKLLGPDWSFLMTDVTQGTKGNGERLAFIFDIRKVKLSGIACEIVIPDEVLERNKAMQPDALVKQFARTPYGVSFKVAEKTFVLLTLHVFFGKKSGDRIAEINAIADWIKNWAKKLSTWNHSLLTLGDFNIVKNGDPTYDAFVSSGLYVPDDLQNIDRTIFKKTYSFYDQIAWFENNISLQYNVGGVFDFRDIVLTKRNYTTSQLSYRISDHFPLWAEFLT